MREYSLAQRARCAEKYLGCADMLMDESAASDWGDMVHRVQPVHISHTVTNTSAIGVDSVREVLIGWGRIGRCSAGLATVRLVEADPFSLVPTDTEDKSLRYESAAAFDELQKLRADETPFRSVLRQLRARTSIHAGSTIADRLETLLEDFQDDYGRSLNPESLRAFIALLVQHPDLKRPVITASDTGNLSVEWKSEDKERFLGLQVLPTHQVRYVAYCPDARNPRLRKYSSGLTSADQLFVDLASYDVLSWARSV